LQNAASEARRRWHQLLLARDWSALEGLFAEDAVLADQRRGARTVARGRAAIVDSAHAIAALRHTFADLTVLATRGERLALSRLHAGASGPAGYEAEVLEVTEVDAEGRISWAGSFDPDADDEAFTALDDRYLGGEAAPFAVMWAPIAEIISAINRHDAPQLPPSYISVDHRPASFPVGHPDAALHSLLDTVPDVVQRIVEVHHLERRGAVVSASIEGTSREGAAVAWSTAMLICADGRVEVFPGDAVDTAVARFDELKRSTLENAASRARRRLDAWILARTWDATTDVFADDVVLDNRRRGVRHMTRGRAAAVEAEKSLADIGVSFLDTRTVATRGDRLALTAIHGGGDKYDADVLCVVESDANGRLLAGITFDADMLDEAFEELDARYVAGDAAPHADAWRRLANAFASFNRGNLSAFDNVDVVDHTSKWLPESDGTSLLQPMTELLPDLALRIVAVHRLGPAGAVITTLTTGTTIEGGETASSAVAVALFDQPTELFPDDRLEEALARYDDLSR
jgi:hypothetical protein